MLEQGHAPVRAVGPNNGDLKDLLYSPMLTTEKIGKQTSKSRMWIVYGLLGACFYCLFGYCCGLYKGNAISGKVVSSYVGLLGAGLIQLY